jgi:hypothetical protein
MFFNIRLPKVLALVCCALFFQSAPLRAEETCTRPGGNGQYVVWTCSGGVCNGVIYNGNGTAIGTVTVYASIC